MAVFAVQAEEYSYTFTAKQFTENGTKTLGNVDWTLEGNGNYWGYDATKGQQFGSGNAPYKSLTLSTSNIKGTISKIVLNTSGASSISGSVQVTVGGKNFGNKITLTKTATNYTLEGSASGNVVISYTQTSSKAIYIKSITITYTNDAGGDGGDEPETPAAPNDPTLTASTTFKGSMDVKITDIAEGAKVYYTTDGTEPSATNGKEYTVPFKITETTTVMAVAVNEGGSSKVVSAVYKVFAVGEVEDVLTLTTTGVSGTGYKDWSGITVNSAAVYKGQSAGGNESIQLRSNNSNSGIVTTASGGKVKSINVEWNTNTAVGRTLDVYGSNTAYTAATDLYDRNTQGTKLGSIVYGTSTTFEIDGDYKCIGLRSNNGAMYLNSISIVWDTNFELSVGNSGYATLYHGYNVTIPANVECYAATTVEKGYVSLEPVTGILPANTGVIVKATAGEYKFEATAETASVESLLKGSTVSEVVTPAGTAYVLGVNEGVVGFYRAELDMNDGVAFLNNANKAYLVVPAASQAVQYFSFNFGAGTTGIEGVEAEGAVSGKIYDITGREVKAITTPGIYIVGGKKVVVK